MPEQAAGRTCGHHGERSSPWSRFVGRTCDPVGDPCWNSLFLRDCTPWKGPTLEQFVKNFSPWEGFTLDKFKEDCLPWEEPHTGAGEECEEEGAVEAICDELTATPISCPPAPLGGEEVEEYRVKLSPERREGWMDGVLRLFTLI